MMAHHLTLPTSALGVGWTLVGLYSLLVIVSVVSLIIDIWTWKANGSPRSIKISFLSFHIFMLCFSLLRLWQVLVILRGDELAVLLGFQVPLNIFSILFFISAYSCIIYNGSKAAFGFRKKIHIWHRILFGMNVLLWVFTVAVVIAFFAGFPFSKKGEFMDPDELLESSRPYHLLTDANLCIVTFAQVFLAVACIVILVGTVRFILGSAEQTKRKKRILRVVKLSFAYSLLFAFFVIRTIFVWREVISHHHLTDTGYLVVELLVPDIAPAVLLYVIEYVALKRKFLSSDDRTTGQSAKSQSHSSSTNTTTTAREV